MNDIHVAHACGMIQSLFGIISQKADTADSVAYVAPIYFVEAYIYIYIYIFLYQQIIFLILYHQCHVF